MVSGETVLNSANVSRYIGFQLFQVDASRGHDDTGVFVLGQGQEKMFEGDFFMLLGLGIVGSAR